MRRDFRLLFPALGIWVGTFTQSLLFGLAQKIFLLALLVLLIITRKKLVGIFSAALFVGAVVLSLHQHALQLDFFREREGDVVKVNHRRTTGKTFTVVEIRRKKALLEDITNRYRYNVALSLIEKTNKITLG